MNAQVLTFAGMHADHRLWQSEHALWRDDLESWQSQHKTALEQLAALEQMIRNHGEALDCHAEDIQRIEHSLREHEKAMAAFQREGTNAEVQEPMLKNHRQQAERQSRQRAAHERIKKHHHTVMAHVMMLKSAIEAAM